MPNMVPGFKKLKARRAYAKELRSHEEELKKAYQEMRTVDDRFKGASTYPTEQKTYAEDKTQDLGASTPQGC
ncbi:hypothetical protein SBOR_5385 [Sclerotinia borealis F-4128]|uniref:Uncharacterized protein n=1 Tax=Sclerotinia borealis (strain F-4128) TaxID=1432307 RepID=W9CEG3_SCLBF|nr:hypothetical protein SBOR_5385 [Sclerotinia borealis F-4128]